MTRTHAAIDARASAEREVFRAFLLAGRDELTRSAILDVLGFNLLPPAEDAAMRRVDRALRQLVAAKRLVRVRKGVYSVIGREAAA